MMPTFAHRGQGTAMQTKGDVASTPGLTLPAPPGAATAFRWFSLTKPIAAGVVTGLLVFVGLETLNILIGDNFHEVAPGSIYRCAQLSGPRLTYYLKRKEIRTVINLRGCCEPSAWYLDECRACARQNVSLEDLGFSAGRLPALCTIPHVAHVLLPSHYPTLA